MKILHISDTHNHHHQLQALPAADVIVHSGDFTMAGTEAEVIDFIEWFCSLPYKHKVFIAGNHDVCLFGADINGLPENCHYLYGNGVTIEGIKFFGIPMFVEDDISGNYTKMLKNVPIDTDVLITHQPSYGILDEGDDIYYGSKVLRESIKRVKPKYHLFGHIHCLNGIKKAGGIIYSNAALVDEDYKLNYSPHVLFPNMTVLKYDNPSFVWDKLDRTRIGPNVTGLTDTVIVYVPYTVGMKANPFIAIRKEYNLLVYLSINDASLVNHDQQGLLSEKEQSLISEWLKLNRTVLLQHWNQEIDTFELVCLLQRKRQK